MYRNLVFGTILLLVALFIVAFAVFGSPGKVIGVSATQETVQVTGTAPTEFTALSPTQLHETELSPRTTITVAVTLSPAPLQEAVFALKTGVVSTLTENENNTFVANVVSSFLTEKACIGTRESCGLPPLIAAPTQDGYISTLISTLFPQRKEVAQAAVQTQAALPTLPPPLQTALAADPKPQTVRIMGQDWPLPPDLYFDGSFIADCLADHKCMSSGIGIRSHSHPDIALYINYEGYYEYGGSGDRHVFDSLTPYLTGLWE